MPALVDAVCVVLAAVGGSRLWLRSLCYGLVLQTWASSIGGCDRSAMMGGEWSATEPMEAAVLAVVSNRIRADGMTDPRDSGALIALERDDRRGKEIRSEHDEHHCEPGHLAATVNTVDLRPTNDEITFGEPEPAGDELQVCIARLIEENSGFSPPSGDWGALLALELVKQLLTPEQAELHIGEASGVQELNLALYQMSYEAALAWEHARQLGAQARFPALGKTLLQRLRPASAAAGDDSGMTTVETVGQLAHLLCLGLINAYEARDRYDYVAMQEVLEECDYHLPSGYTLKSFRVFECLLVIARSGLSRNPGGSVPSRRDLAALAELVSADREQGGGPYTDFCLLLLVVAVGHAQRQDLVDNALRDMQLSEDVDDGLTEEAEAASLSAWMLDVLQDMEDRGLFKDRDWPIADKSNPIAHHMHYYRHFAHHVQAIALATQLKRATATHVEGATSLSVSDVKREYSRASSFLERALQLVPRSNEARWRYYELNAENLEHEASLRTELLEQRLATRQTVASLAEDAVGRFSMSAQEELRTRIADVSMRVVEVIGIFLAVVAILGVTIASATVDGLSLSGRIWLLAIGGSMPVVYFVLLKWIVIGKVFGRPTKEEGSVP